MPHEVNPACTKAHDELFGRLRQMEGTVNTMSGSWNTLRVVLGMFGLAFFLAFLASTMKWFDVASDLATIKTQVQYLSKEVPK